MQIKDIARESDGTRQEIVLTLVADTDEVKKSIDTFFNDISKREIPGFRKGKAPRAVLEQSVGVTRMRWAALLRCLSMNTRWQRSTIRAISF